MGYHTEGFGSRGGATKKRCEAKGCRKVFPLLSKLDRRKKFCSKQCREREGKTRARNNTSWGPLVPAEPVYRAIRWHETCTGETVAMLSKRIGWNSKAIHTMMCGRRKQIRLGTADKLLCAISRVDIFWTELADWYFLAPEQEPEERRAA